MTWPQVWLVESTQPHTSSICESPALRYLIFRRVDRMARPISRMFDIQRPRRPRISGLSGGIWGLCLTWNWTATRRTRTLSLSTCNMHAGVSDTACLARPGSFDGTVSTHRLCRRPAIETSAACSPQGAIPPARAEAVRRDGSSSVNRLCCRQPSELFPDI